MDLRLPNFLSKTRKEDIFQLNKLIDVSLDTIDPSLKTKLNLDEKYLFKKKIST